MFSLSFFLSSLSLSLATENNSIKSRGKSLSSISLSLSLSLSFTLSSDHSPSLPTALHFFLSPNRSSLSLSLISPCISSRRNFFRRELRRKENPISSFSLFPLTFFFLPFLLFLYTFTSLPHSCMCVSSSTSFSSLLSPVLPCSSKGEKIFMSMIIISNSTNILGPI